MPIISTFYGHWDYWNLRHKVTFDGVNKLILVNEGITELDVQRDIYSAWKEWLLLESATNTKYEQALITVGGEPTVSGQRLDVTYFLINGWKLKPYQGTYDLNLIGNIFDVDGGTIKVPADINIYNPNNITINTTTSVIVRQVTPEITFNDDDRTDILNISSSVNSNNELLLNISSSNSTEFNQISASNVYQESLLLELSASAASNGALLLEISGSLLEIKNKFDVPITASLVSEQETALYDIQSKLTEIWKIHGLDITNPLTVNRTSRVVDTITQTISTIGSGSTQETTITRT